MTTETKTATKVILSYGMGVDSTAILLRWIEEPETRDFDLADLVVLTAQTGDEYAETGRDVEACILPRLRAAGIRFVEVARAGAVQADGIKVLQDSRAPEQMHLEGAYRLSQELLGAATIVIMGGTRKCSQKAKGAVLDAWLEGELEGAAYRHVIGFEANETGRRDRDQTYGGNGRIAEYPLITWGWDRQTCIDYIRSVTGVEWRKSCCEHCPFAGGTKAGQAELATRWVRVPEAAARVLVVENAALSMNPNMKLFKTRSAYDVVVASSNTAALEAFDQATADSTWAVYQVRRVWTPKVDKATNTVRRDAKGQVQFMKQRSVHTVFTGSRTEALAELEKHGNAVARGYGFARVYTREGDASRPETQVEELYVAAPHTATDKARPSFEAAFEAVA